MRVFVIVAMCAPIRGLAGVRKIRPIHDKRQRLVLGGALLGALWPAHLVPQQAWLAGAFALGVPHGAVDHKLHAMVHDDTNFCEYYFSMMAGSALLWGLSPTLALGIFAAISAFHFGETQLFYLPKNSRWTVPAQTCWGLGVLAAILLPHWEDARAVLDALGIGALPHMDSLAALGLAPLCLGAAIMAGADETVLAHEVAESAVLGVLLVQAPMLLGFAFFFIFWHTLPSIDHQIMGFRRYVDEHFGIADYVREAVPCSLAAFAAMLLMLVTRSDAALAVADSAAMDADSAALVAFAFVSLALLTAPHVGLISAFEHKLFAKDPQQGR